MLEVFKTCTYVAAMRDVFYTQNGNRNDTLKGFMDELKALTPEDKLEFRAMLATIGFELTDNPKEMMVQ